MSAEEVDSIIEKYEDITKERHLTIDDIFDGQQMLQETISERIDSCYAAIEITTAKLDSRDPKMGQKTHDLTQLKLFVPKKFAITKKNMHLLNDTLNRLVGVNISDIKEE